MADYKLNIFISGPDLSTIDRCKQRVVIVKHSSGGEQLAWVTFKPFERNCVEWTEEYALYASTNETQNGAKILKMSDCIAQAQVNAIFTKGWFSDFESCALPANTFKVTNKHVDNRVLTFGLAQSVLVNGTSFDNHPLNAVPVALNHSATMSPIERISVYLAANLDSSTVLTEVDSLRLDLTYSGDVNELSITYDPNSGSFHIY
jgi:hypothetical protein